MCVERERERERRGGGKREREERERALNTVPPNPEEFEGRLHDQSFFTVQTLLVGYDRGSFSDNYKERRCDL